MKSCETIIISLQVGIWEANYFLERGIKVDYWTGKKRGLETGLNGFRAVGISVEDVTEALENPFIKL